MASRLFIFLCLFSFNTTLSSANPNPPTWPSTVSVYSSITSLSTIQSDFDAVFATHGGQSPSDNGQFVNLGHAFLFAPGTYSSSTLSLNVGYYTSVIGMGITPSDTTINSVNAPAGGSTASVGSLNTFWRSAENFSTTPMQKWPGTTAVGMTWAVSQACPLRRVHISGTLYLFQLYPTEKFASGDASGGFMADCKIEQTAMDTNAVFSGSQQQWLSRNCTLSVPAGSSKPEWSNGVWNQVFVGCTNAPDSHCSNCNQSSTPPCSCLNCAGPGCKVSCLGDPYTNIAKTPIIGEKPYIVSNSTATTFQLAIPPIETEKIGISGWTSPTLVDFSQVYVANPTDTADTINAEITNGNHIILTPGVYELIKPIEVNQDNLVILGIGFPILVSTNGKPCIQVGNQSGVRIAAILLQAGPNETKTLLQWGDSDDSSSIQSGFLSDCFARCGRFTGNINEPFNQVDKMIEINSSNVVLDNLWLWRADHDTQGIVYNENNPCKTACEINGNHVTAYGLACEHTLQDLCQWNGDFGKCYFYQAEFPYDVTSSYGTLGYTGYRVANEVTSHLGVGIGVYSFFRDHLVTAKMAISAPLGQNIQFTNVLTRYLSGNGGIESILNGTYGFNTLESLTPSVNGAYPGPAYLCDSISENAIARKKPNRR